jgi:rod shape-determining protein MreD
MALPEQIPGIRPRATIGGRLDFAARAAVPFAFALLGLPLTKLPFGIPHQAALPPAVTLIAVWFWSLFRPASMPPPAVFALGLLLDLVGYLPLGVGVLTLLTAHGIALLWRRFVIEQGFALAWLAFLPIALGGAVMVWALTALLSLRVLPAGPALFQALMTAALYPVLAIPLAWAHRTIADTSQG